MKTAGGNAANVAAGVSKLGLTAAVVSEIGADTDAHVITDQLKKTGVDLTYLKKNKKNTSKTNYILNFIFISIILWFK
jgi:sugar/nucleoside kinase (ribokinase family)